MFEQHPAERHAQSVAAIEPHAAIESESVECSEIEIARKSLTAADCKRRAWAILQPKEYRPAVEPELVGRSTMRVMKPP
jgi:hypothetical protein